MSRPLDSPSNPAAWPPIALVIAGGMIAALTVAFLRYVQDDVFITYTYSRHLAEGVGFVFNPGERVQGTTTPLWTLIMAAAYRVTPDLLTAGNLLSGLGLAGVCLLVWRLLNPKPHRRASSAAQTPPLSPLVRIGAVWVIASAPLNYASFGMESLFYTAVLMLAFYLWASERRGWAMLAAAALTWTRADGIVLAGTFGLIALGESLAARQPLRLAAIYLLGTAPWFLFATLYFGSPLPNTFSAKQGFLQGILFLSDGVERWRSFFGTNPLTLLAAIVLPMGIWRAWQDARLRPLPVWLILYVLGYTALNVSNFWYYTAAVNAAIVLSALGAGTLWRWIGQRTALRPYLRPAALILIALVVVPNIARAFDFAAPPPRMATYRLAGEWIAAHTPPDSTLLLADLGVAGYYARRHTLDSFGLIVPDIAARREFTPEAAVRRYAPDYVLATQYWLFDFTSAPWFGEQYRPLASFSTPGDAEFSPMTVYVRRAAQANAMTRISPSDDARWTFARLVAWNAGDDGQTVEVWSGGSLALDLTWQIEQPISSDWSVFLHLLDADGQVVAQADGYPAGADQPTDALVDARTIVLPPDLPAGDYRLRLGWYAWRTGERIPRADGGDELRLPLVVRNRFPGGSGLP